MTFHIVQPGDTISSIAAKYSIPITRFLEDNNLPPNATLSQGQSLMIIYPEQTYTVKSGDTLEDIAKTFGVTAMQLLRNNPQLSDRTPLTLNDGEVLVISYNNKEKQLQVYGYANVFISEQVLRKTLPFLTYLSILHYRITLDAELVDINDTDIIHISKEYGVAPIMFISSITAQGQGNYDVTHGILNSPDLRAKLINNVLSVMKAKGYYGVEVSMFHVKPEDLPLYVTFISDITNRLNAEGFPVFVTLVPSTFGYKPGTPYTNTYYADIGKVANYVILISYSWSSAYISQVAETTYDYLKAYIEFAITQIPPEKIFIGLTRLGYDWTLPYEEGKTLGNLVTNFGAVNLANQLGATIQFDETTQTPYFYYHDSGADHFVWFKDARTVDSIINLVFEYGLKGVSVWNIMFYYSPTWLVINTQYDVVKLLPSNF